MLEARAARQQDRDEFYDLWKICFGDSKAFMDWFFSERFFPELSTCISIKGRIIASMQSYPLHIRMRETILPVLMVAGVCTHPEHRGLGYMRLMFESFMQQARGLGISVVVHTPAYTPTFFSIGQYPVTDTLYLSLKSSGGNMPEGVSVHSMHTGLAPLHTCYQLACAKYSGSVSRSIADFAYKLRDYASDGAGCLARIHDGAALGYCIYYEMGEELHVEECFALKDEALSQLLLAVAHRANGRSLSVKLPPDYNPVLEGAELIIKPQGAMGIADVSAALYKLLRDEDYVFELTDGAVKQNTGRFNGLGVASAKMPQLQLEAGRLAQFLSGYRSIEELAEQGHAKIFDYDAAKSLDAKFPKQTCFITDEY